MEKAKYDLTKTVITILISLMTIIGFASVFISNQAKIETQLANINTQIVDMNIKLDKRDEEIKILSTRLTILETELRK